MKRRNPTERLAAMKEKRQQKEGICELCGAECEIDGESGEERCPVCESGDVEIG